MTTENPNPVNLVPEGRANEDFQRQETPANTQSTETRPPSGLSTSTEATEESLSTYAERTVEAIIARDTPGSASLLPPLAQKQEKAEQAKVSMSEEISIIPRAATSIIPRDGAGDVTTTHVESCRVGRLIAHLNNAHLTQTNISLTPPMSKISWIVLELDDQLPRKPRAPPHSIRFLGREPIPQVATNPMKICPELVRAENSLRCNCPQVGEHYCGNILLPRTP